MKKIYWLICFINFSCFASVIPDEPHIYVEGFAEFGIYPDQIKITVLIEEINLNAEVAKAEVDKKSLILFNTLKLIGIKSDNITATPIKIVPAIKYNNGERTNIGTEISRSIDITLKNLKNYSQLNDAIINAGISEKVSSSVEVTNERELKKKALMLALKDAKTKAEDIAKLQNKKIKDIHSISEFKTRQEDFYSLQPVQAIYGQSYRDARAGGITFNAPPPPGIFEIGEMKVMATVYVVYTIE